MQLLLWLASVTRCVSATLCPTDADLLQAMRAENADKTTAAAQRPSSDGTILLIHFFDPDEVSEVICGDGTPHEPLTVTCKFTVRYPRSDAYRVAKLVKTGEVWEIREAMQVSRERRNDQRE